MKSIASIRRLSNKVLPYASAYFEMWRVRKHLPLDTHDLFYKTPVMSCDAYRRAILSEAQTTASNRFTTTGRLISVPLLTFTWLVAFYG
jgi:hypothetical protein